MLALNIVWVGLCRGYTVSVLWGWFVAPLFHLPTLTIASAYGLALVYTGFSDWNTPKADTSKSVELVMAESAVRALTISGMLLGIGWCVKTWFM